MMEAAMPCTMRTDKNSELLDKFGMVNEPTSVLACAGSSCGTTRKKKKKNVFVPQLWLRMDDCALLSSLFVLSCFLSVSFCIALSFTLLFLSSCWCWRQGGRSEETVMERNWSGGGTDEWQQRGRDNQRNGSIFSSDKYLNFKGASADTGMWKCCTATAQPHPPPPLLLLLLANHHTTLLYLGHSNVLLLPPLADALCRNPPPPKKK